MSADSSTTPAAAVAPVPERAAIAILGSMILLIVALTVILVQTTWVNPANASEIPPAPAEQITGR